MPAAGERASFGPAVLQYYPGRGMQLQPLASWGRVNWLARTCLQKRRACPVRELRRSVDGLLDLAARRGDFLAWEHYFSWAGGTPPWISGMTQATRVWRSRARPPRSVSSAGAAPPTARSAPSARPHRWASTAATTSS